MRHIIFEIIALIVTSAVTSIIFWLVTPDKMIAAKNIIPILIIILIILYGAIKYIFQLKDELNNANQIKLPKLKTIQQGYLIFEPSELFASQMVVSLYYKNAIEQFIGYGTIDTVTTDKKMIQVVIVEYVPDWNETKAKKNKDKIILKPTIPKYILDKVGHYE